MLDFITVAVSSVLVCLINTERDMSNYYFLTVMSAFLLPSVALCQLGAPGGEWPTYGGELGHTRYSALDQVDSSNFS